MAFALELQSAGHIGDAFAAVVAPVDAGVRTAPDLADRLLHVDLLSVEIHRDLGLLGQLAVLEAGRAEVDVVGVPLAEAVELLVRRRRLVYHRAHAVRGLVAFLDLDLVAVLEVHAAVALRVHHGELDVQAEVAVGLFGDDVRGAVLAAGGGRIVGHHDRPRVDRIIHDLPLDGHRRRETRPLPIGPLRVEHLPRAVEEDLGAADRTRPDTDTGGGGRHGRGGCCGEDQREKTAEGGFHEVMTDRDAGGDGRLGAYPGRDRKGRIGPGRSAAGIAATAATAVAASACRRRTHAPHAAPRSPSRPRAAPRRRRSATSPAGRRACAGNLLR